jgi:hypothetical protein
MASVRHLGLFPYELAYGAASSGPLPDVEGGDGLGRYVKMPLEAAMFAWWVVKKWRVAMQCAGSNVIDEIFYPWANFVEEVEVPRNSSALLEYGTENITEGEQVENEKHLVCDRFGERGGVTVQSLGSTGSVIGNYGYSVSIFQTGGTPLPTRQAKDDPKNYWAYFDSFFNPAAVRAFLSTSYSQAQNWYGGEVASVSEVGKMRIDVGGAFAELEFPYYMGLRAGEGTVNASINLTLKAVEFFPYDPGDGLGPIYDRSTGAQLRSFPST